MSAWQNILAINALARYVRTCPSGKAGTTPFQSASMLTQRIPMLALTPALLVQCCPSVIHKYNGLIIAVICYAFSSYNTLLNNSLRAFSFALFMLFL